jgi:hypothetical protein
VTIDGKEYSFSYAKFAHIRAFEVWARKKLLDEALEALGPKASAVERTTIIRQMMNQMDYAVQLEMSSVRGLAKHVELMLKAHHPGITSEEVDAVIDGFGMREIRALIDSLSGVKLSPEDEMKQMIAGYGIGEVEQLIAQMKAEAETPDPPASVATPS